MSRRISRMTALLVAFALLCGSFGTAFAVENPSATVVKNPAFAGGDKRVDAFSDVNMHWARESIEFAVQNNLMNGMTATEFWPNYQMTRAMLVTVLWRIEGKPAYWRAATFDDVPQGLWYSDAVSWAAERGIVDGMGDNKFQPMRPISRQDFCVMLYRFAVKTNRDENAWLPAVVFTDYEDIALYVRDGINWCSQRGIVQGRPAGEFSPRDTTTRAEGCHMLRMFLEGHR